MHQRRESQIEKKRETYHNKVSAPESENSIIRRHNVLSEEIISNQVKQYFWNYEFSHYPQESNDSKTRQEYIKNQSIQAGWIALDKISI